MSSEGRTVGLQSPVATILGTGRLFELNVLGFIVAVIASVMLVGTAESLAARQKN